MVGALVTKEKPSLNMGYGVLPRSRGRFGNEEVTLSDNSGENMVMELPSCI